MKRLLPDGLALVLLLLLLGPLLLLVLSTPPAALAAAMMEREVQSAVMLSLSTSIAAAVIMAAGGLPLAWRLSRRRTPHLMETLLEIPVVLPPAVVGVALLYTFGRNGPLGAASIAFTVAAVVLAQTVVAAPLFVQGATAAFRQVDEDHLLIAETLGATRWTTLTQVVIPLALPGLLSGMALAWARAIGEFGATLMFAGNLPHRTQTLPLAIYTALERDVTEAQAVAVILLALAVLVLVGLRGLARWMAS